MQDAKKAKEWATGIDYQPCSHEPEEVEVAKFILNLPDQIIDANKVRELADQIVEEAGDFASEGLAHRYMTITKRLRDILPAPSLPTLADLIEAGNDPQKYRWMQCVVETDDGDVIGVIRTAWRVRVDVIFQSGAVLDVEHRRATPRPDLPRLEWPAQEPQPEYRPNLGPITLGPPTREEEAEVRKQFEEPAPSDLPRLEWPGGGVG